MNAALLSNLSSSTSILEQIGWVLLHFLWQGVLVALIVALMLSASKRMPAQLRYAIAVTGLFVMAACPVASFFSQAKVTAPAEVPMWSREFESGTNYLATLDATTRQRGDQGESAEHDLKHEAIPVERPAGLVTVATSKNGESWSVFCEKRLRPWMRHVTQLWLVGIVLLSMRLMLIWRQVQQIRLRSVPTKLSSYQQLLDSLASRVGIRPKVRLLESGQVEIPTVIGWFKPVILLPLASLSSLTPSQLEAILMHELAHIRRHDYLVNMLQNLIETLLFYHPAVWWVSTRIREEREYCCDDIAARVGGNAREFAAALVRMEELRVLPPEMAMAVRGGHLLNRVRRLLAPQRQSGVSSWWMTGFVTLLFVGSVIAISAPIGRRAESFAADKADTPAAAATDAAPVLLSLEELVKLTPAQIADRIEDAWKRYDSVEFAGTMEIIRNTNAFFAQKAPHRIETSGAFRFRADAGRWFAFEKTQLPGLGTDVLYPDEITSVFDGTSHATYNGATLTLGEQDLVNVRLLPREFFWRCGLTNSWLTTALRRPEAKVVGTSPVEETICVDVDVRWKPEWDTADRHFKIVVAPNEGWLVRKVVIERGEKPVADWTIASVGRTASGLYFPTQIMTTKPEEDPEPLTKVSITEFENAKRFQIDDFRLQRAWGGDIVDHRSGVAWNNDPWWNDLAPWIRENVGWPVPDLTPLHELRSTCPEELNGLAAPPLEFAGEWISGGEPKSSARNIRILHFFSGRLVAPAPRQLKALDELAMRYRQHGVEVIGIASPTNPPKLTRQAVEELRLSFPIMIDAVATPAQVEQEIPGAHWGRTFAAFRQPTYSGTVLIGLDGDVLTLSTKNPNSLEELSHVERLIRGELTSAGRPADAIGDKELFANRLSLGVRGTPASFEELRSIDNDATLEWAANFERAVRATIRPEQAAFLKSRGLTIAAQVKELRAHSSRLPSAGLARIEEEWKRRSRSTEANGKIQARIRKADTKIKNGRAEVTEHAVKATIDIVPELRLLGSNQPGSWTVAYDRSRQQTIETDANGQCDITKLPKGTYRLTISSPNLAKVSRTVYVTNQTVYLDLDLTYGDTVTGVIKSVDNRPVANARVTAIKRYASPENPHSYTTEFLPGGPVTTSSTGEFVFSGLYDGKYVFEVTKDGYQTLTTAQINAGAGQIELVLRPETDDANR